MSHRSHTPRAQDYCWGGYKGKKSGGVLTSGYRKGWLQQEGVWEEEGGTKGESETTTTNALRGWQGKVNKNTAEESIPGLKINQNITWKRPKQGLSPVHARVSKKCPRLAGQFSQEGDGGERRVGCEGRWVGKEHFVYR